MFTDNFIPEEAAAAFAGVSVQTLLRFAEAGYLQVENRNGGPQLFARSEIKEVFGIKDQEEVRLLEDAITTAPIQPGISETKSTLQIEKFVTVEPENQPGTESTEPGKQPSYFVPRAVVLMEQELARLRNLSELQDRLLESREAELRELRSQRDWLKERLEALEEKSTRDQVLLLSSEQTVRQLIAINERRHSPVRATLEWFGLVRPLELSAPAASLQDRR